MLWYLLQNAIVASAMAVVVFVICRWKRVGPAGRHFLWVIVLVKLITPPIITWPWAVPNVSERFVTRHNDPLPDTERNSLESEQPESIDDAGDFVVHFGNLHRAATGSRAERCSGCGQHGLGCG